MIFKYLTTSILQHDSLSCGLACLKFVCKHYGKKCSTTELQKLCPVTKEGVSLLGLSEAANNFGFRTLCAKVPISVLEQAQLPCILHWDRNHFVVLCKIKDGKKFYVADPGRGLVSYVKEEFKKHWIDAVKGETENSVKGVAMFLETTSRFYAQNSSIGKAPKLQSGLRVLLSYSKSHCKRLVLIAFGLIVGSLLQLLFPYLMRLVVDIGIGNKDIGFVWLVLLGQLVLSVSRSVIDFVRRRLLMHASLRINMSMVSDFFAKLLKLPMSFFDSKQTGDLLQRINDHRRVSNFLTQHFLYFAVSLFSFMILSVVLIHYDWMVFAVFFSVCVINSVWSATFLKRRKVIDYELFELQAVNNNKVYEFVTTMQEIKLQGYGKPCHREWGNTQEQLFQVQMETLKLQQMQETGSLFLNEARNLIVTVVAATAVIKGEMTLGTMLAVQYILGMLSTPIEQLMTFLYSLQDVKISLERINEIRQMNDENEIEGLQACVQNAKLGICVKDVTFKYAPKSLRKATDNVSFCVPKGKLTAIVGASGSGKTTLLRLMLGYYPIESGMISIGDTNVNSIDKVWWHQQCGVVMQDGAIFSTTIARNIAVDDAEVDENRLLYAAEIACIKDYIMELPLKFDTKIGRDGMALSQGQKQRILIARTVYKDPEYLFFDEATNSLDANNERSIVNNLNTFYRGKTVVIVAHRLSTVWNADQIIVLANGKVVETGNHESLTEKRGAYYDLVKNQLDLDA